MVGGRIACGLGLEMDPKACSGVDKVIVPCEGVTHLDPAQERDGDVGIVLLLDSKDHRVEGDTIELKENAIGDAFHRCGTRLLVEQSQLKQQPSAQRRRHMGVWLREESEGGQ